MTEIRVGKTESIDSALRRFKRATQKAGVLSEVRKREHYEKPSSLYDMVMDDHGQKTQIQIIRLGALVMSLRELLQTDMKTAMKERESGKERLSVLRMVWAAVRNKEIDEKTELTDDAVMAVLMKEVKQREDTIKEIKDANRPDLVAKNEEEIEILKKYLPEPLSDEELKKVIQDVIATTGAKSMKDMGKVMGRVLAQTQGRAAGSRVSALVKELLK